MAEASYPFDTSGVSTPSMGEDQWRRWGKQLSPDGVHGGYGSSFLAVTAAGDGLSINIAIGYANVQGALYANDATLNKTNTANGAGSARPDRVVLRYDQTANSTTAVVREGTAGGAAPPVLTQATTGQWEIPLARWSRAAGGGITGLIDERQFLDRSGGLVIADTAVTTAVPLTALLPGAIVGQAVTLLPSAKEYRWSGTFWERVDNQALLDVVDATLGTSTVTSYTAGSPSGDFVAPLSGRVRVRVNAYMNPEAGQLAYFVARIAGPAGYDQGMSDTNAAIAAFRTNTMNEYAVSGLTPGSTYNATGYHKQTGVGAAWDSRKIIVERA